MRLFVGVETGPAVADAAAALIAHLRGRAESLAPRSRITWVTPERLHITVRFIGQADEEKTRDIQAVLRPPMQMAPFTLAVAGTGAFPPSGPPRAIWAGISDGLDALRGLEREVTARLARAGVAPEEREYRPHVTLGRVREAAGLRASALLDARGDVRLGATRVEAITLFESRLSSKGPTYVTLDRTRLEI